MIVQLAIPSQNESLLRPGNETTERRRAVTRPALQPWMTRCAVDAHGVRAEWVESVMATVDQETIVYFSPDKPSRGSNDGHDHAVRLALVTGARVLRVECTMALDGATAYAWLLGEGLDLNTTTFAGPTALLTAVRAEAVRRALPLPHNLVAERVLGLPPEPRPDRDPRRQVRP